ncbi:MAG: polyprenyl diphosphate synthase [Gemmatimonadota bacterium]
MNLHVAIIMDGNGRWATRRGWPRSAGHRAGAEAVRRAISAAPERGIGVLTLFAFSGDNWRRPALEVEALMSLFRRFLKREASECARHGIRLNVIGRRDRLSLPLNAAIAAAERLTQSGTRLLVRVAVDYSAQESILSAAHEGGPVDRAAFARRLGSVSHSLAGVPNVDLLIRTGGERRLSDFLLWESAYAELYFSDVMWPDFNGDMLAEAITEFHQRERRFGGLDLGRTG